MKILLLLCAATLALASCSKSDPDPAPIPAINPTGPTLLAKWQVDSTWINTTATAPKTSIRTYPAQAVGWEFTSSEWLIYSGSTIDKRYGYTKSGSALSVSSTPSSQQIITSLTAHRLVLQSVPDGYPAGTAARTYTAASR